jgi:TolB protein
MVRTNDSWKRTRRGSITGLMLLASASVVGCSAFENVGYEKHVQTPVSPAGEDLPPIDATTPTKSTKSKPGGTATAVAQVRSPVAPGRPPVAPVKAPGVEDMMFADADPFAAAPATSVNIFGELDGLGPSVFTVGGTGGFAQHTYVDEGYDADPEVSPDGKQLLYASTRHAEQPDLYIQKIDGLSVTQLTQDPADDAFPTFSPDMSRIAFASNRAGSWDIYVMDADGKNVSQVTRTISQEIHPSFSPDGMKLAYCALGSRSGQWEVWVVDLKTLERRMVGYGLFPEWSPREDKDVIAFQRARQRGTRWFSAWTLELTDGEAKNVSEIAFSTNAAIVTPTWSNDGRKVAFATIIDPNQPVNTEGTEPARATSHDIWTVNADGTDRRRLTDGRGTNATPTWSPDGRVFFVTDRSGTECVWSTTAAQTTLTADAPTDEIEK